MVNICPKSTKKSPEQRFLVLILLTFSRHRYTGKELSKRMKETHLETHERKCHLHCRAKYISSHPYKLQNDLQS